MNIRKQTDFVLSSHEVSFFTGNHVKRHTGNEEKTQKTTFKTIPLTFHLQGLIRKFKNIEPFKKKNVQGFHKSFLAENTGFFEHYSRILTLKLGDNLIWYGTLCIYIYTIQGYPLRMSLQRRLYTKFDYPIFLHLGFLIGQNWLISVLNQSVNRQHTQMIKLNAETKKQASNRHIFRVL